MSTAIITLSSPQDYNLQSLAETTRQSLALLKPWTLLKPSPNNTVRQKIAEQALKYTAAIQAGVSASYSGFTVTEEVLFLAKSLPVEDQEDLQRYLVGMMELAREARDNANKAYAAFRDVRQEIFALASQLELEGNEDGKKGGVIRQLMRPFPFICHLKGTSRRTSARKGLPEYHRRDLEVLIKFAEHISAFANWWDWVKIETDPAASKDQPLSFQIDSLRDPEVVKRWNRLRSQYTAYVQMISEIEDTDPQFFNHSLSSVPKPSESVDTHEVTFSNTLSHPEASESQHTTSPCSSHSQKEQPRKPTPSYSGQGKDKIYAGFVRHFRATYPKFSKSMKVLDPRGVLLVPAMVKSGFKIGFKKARSKMSTLNFPGSHNHKQGSTSTSSITDKVPTAEPEPYN